MTDQPADKAGELIPFPQRDVEELPPGELVDADHDGIPDTHHSELAERPSSEVRESGTEIADGELVEEKPAGPPVDQPHREDDSLAARAGREMQRRPVVAPWMTDRQERAAVARWMVGHVAHHTAYHSVRLPLYGGKLLVRSPLGVWRVVDRSARWLVDAEGHPLRQYAVAHNDHQAYLQLTRIRDERIKRRLIIAGVTVLMLVALCLVLAFAAPWWADTLAISASLVTLGVLGAPVDKPLISPAVVTFQAPRLTSDLVVKALSSLGLSGLTPTGKTAPSITFPNPITREGFGWRADVDLPHGVTVTQILSKREELASGLRRSLGCVWPERDPESHAARLVLFVADKDLRKAKQPKWPLDRVSIADVFAPIPLGTDPRGRIVSIELMFANLLLGAMPRQGKTATMRIILLGLALDPTVELRIFELKGTGDLSPLEPVCHHYASGAGKTALELAMASLRGLKAELEKRAERISQLARRDRGIVPDNKVTRQLADDRKYGLWPIVLGIDECQNLFTDEDHGKEAADLCTDIIKLGPALGIMLILATQRPDKDSLPKAISANVALRLCLYVSGQTENDMVLGTSSYQQGIRATSFTPILDAGIGILRGAGPEATTVKGFYKDGPAAVKVVERARVLRAQAGTLTGYAVGEELQVDEWSVLDDVARVFQAGEDQLWSETILSRLQALRPEIYGAWKPAALAAALKPYGAEPGQVWMADERGVERNRRGYSVDAIAEAVSSRMIGPGSGSD